MKAFFLGIVLIFSTQMGFADDAWLSDEELDAVTGRGDPYQVIKPPF